MIENIILETYLKQAVHSIGNFIQRNNEFVFNCNLCGDSQHKHKRRGHLKLLSKNGQQYWYYKCFNGGCRAYEKGMTGKYWLKLSFPEMFYNYKLQSFNTNPVKTESIEEIAICKTIQTEIELKKEKEKKDIKSFKSILSSNGNIFQKAIEECKRRKIPEHIWKKFYISIDGTYKNYMIIPFYDNFGKIYYFQARNLLNDGKPKYLNRNTNKENSFYNIHNIDSKKPVIILEGPIDSMFCENSIALLGLNSNEKIDEFDSYYIFDYDIPGKKLSKEYLIKGKNVFLWEKYFKKNDIIHDKNKKMDINDLFLLTNRTNIFTFNELQEYFSNKIYDIMYF